MVLQVADVVAEPAGLPAWTMTVLVYLAVIGFPLAAFFGWRYEMTDHGLVRTRPASSTEDVDLSLKTGDYLTIAALIVASGLVGWQVIPTMMERVEQGSGEPAEIKISPNSVAVLPFDDISAGGDQGFLADGVSDTITLVLGQAKGLIVTARTSSLVFKNRAENVLIIAKELRVAHILEGSVQRAGNKVRIIARLVETKGGTEVWSDSFNREVDDIFEIQDEISTRVLAALKERLPKADLDLTDQYRPNLDAYEQMILGRQVENERTMEGRARAAKHYRKAIDLDPNYALAYIRLADLEVGRPDISRKEKEERIWPLIYQAIELNPALAEAHLSLALVQREKGQSDKAEQSILKAIDLNSNLVEARTAYASWLMMLQRLDESLKQAEIAAKIDPKNPKVIILLSQAYWNVSRSEAAIAIAQDLLRQYPKEPRANAMLAGYTLQLGRAGESMLYTQALLKMDPANPDSQMAVCTMWMQLWDIERGLDCYRKVSEQFPDKTDARLQIAWNTRDYAKAIEIAEKQAEANPWWRYRKAQLAAVLLDAQEYKHVIEVIEDGFPQLFDAEPQIDSFSVWPALLIAQAYIETGARDKSAPLLDAAEYTVVRMRKLQSGGLVSGIEDAQIHALRGEHDRAMDALDTAIDSGWMYYSWGLARDPNFKAIWDDRRFRSIVQKLADKMAEQRQWYEEHKDDPTI